MLLALLGLVSFGVGIPILGYGFVCSGYFIGVPGTLALGGFLSMVGWLFFKMDSKIDPDFYARSKLMRQIRSLLTSKYKRLYG